MSYVNTYKCCQVFMVITYVNNKSSSCCNGGRVAMSSGDGIGFLSCLLMSCCVCVLCWEGFLDLIIKLSSIMVTRNLWSVRVWVRDWLCKGKTHHPQCTLPKVSCIVVWLFFLSWVFIRWSFFRFKVYLSLWESLYLIGLNPNHSKIWILASYFNILYL